MRNTTKLKHVLTIYTLALELDDDGKFHLSLFHKVQDVNETFIEKSWSAVVSKAYSYMLRNLK